VIIPFIAEPESGDLEWRDTGLMARPAKEPRNREWSLQNDITLTISQRRPSSIGAVADFLDAALEDLKERRANGEEFFEDRIWERWVVNGRTICGTGWLAHPGYEPGKYLSTDKWVKAIIAARTAAMTVMNIQADTEGYRAQAEDWLMEAVVALGKRGGDLDAFEIILKRVNAQVFQEPQPARGES